MEWAREGGPHLSATMQEKRPALDPSRLPALSATHSFLACSRARAWPK